MATIRKLNRDSSTRKALFRDLVTDLFIHERIQTTEAKAKEIRSIAEKLITLRNAVIFMHVVKLLLLFVEKLLTRIKMRFKNYSPIWLLATPNVQADTHVSLNWDLAAVMQHQWFTWSL